MRSRERGDGDQTGSRGSGAPAPEVGQPSQPRRIGLPGADGSAPAELPSKLYFRIGEVAALVGVEPHVLRYWETEFRSIRPQKSARGQRVYSRRDLDTLLRIRELLYQRGFTIAGARKELRDRGIEPRPPDDPTARNADKMRTTLVELRDEIRSLLAEIER
jgi:DNA-binding transcriptional MerR regulator